jgi:hypothetical protein
MRLMMNAVQYSGSGDWVIDNETASVAVKTDRPSRKTLTGQSLTSAGMHTDEINENEANACSEQERPELASNTALERDLRAVVR